MAARMTLNHGQSRFDSGWGCKKISSINILKKSLFFVIMLNFDNIVLNESKRPEDIMQ